jgi:hypothetical protein
MRGWSAGILAITGDVGALLLTVETKESGGGGEKQLSCADARAKKLM